MLDRNRAFLPRVCRFVRFLRNDAESLAFEVLEIKRRATVAFRDLSMRHARRLESLFPPGETRVGPDAQARTHDTRGAAAFAADWPVEECDVSSRRRETVGIEKVIRRDVVLIHRLLHE